MNYDILKMRYAVIVFLLLMLGMSGAGRTFAQERTQDKGNVYTIVPKGLIDGATMYIDRDYTFTSVPDELKGLDYIKTAMDDAEKGEDALKVCISLSKDATVYLLYDRRYDGDIDGTWITKKFGFKKTTLQVEATPGGMGYMTVWSADMAAGDYEFGFCPGGDPCMYILAATKDIASVSSNYPALKAFSGVYKPETPEWPVNPPDSWVTYHLAHPGPGDPYPGDPNPAFYYKGRYHMHYIYDSPKNPFRGRKHGWSFAHVSSKDMVHWKWHTTVLTPTTMGHGMFSGTGFFTKEGKAVMIYHGEGSDRNWLAYALDDNMDKWSKPEAIEPKAEDGQTAQADYWDPDCWLNGDTYYAISGGKDPHLMKSPDLKNWKYLGRLLHDDYPSNLGIKRSEDISCANMFKIGNKWMLLCISHSLGCRYYLGDFKDEKYLPDFHAKMSWNGTHFFAPESVLSKDGRRVMWAWLQEGGDMKVDPDGIQSLPRELELPKDGILRIKPLRELEKLRYDKKREKKITVKSDETYVLKEIAGHALELKVEFESSAAKEFGVDVLCDKNGENGVRIAMIPKRKILRVGIVDAPFELKDGEDLTLRIFIDKSLVEVFANDRQAALSAPEKFSPRKTHVSLFAKGSDVKVKTLTAWKMKSAYEGKSTFYK